MRFKTWYPSFHPEELVGRETETLYVCQWCFKYACDMRQYLTHLVNPFWLLLHFYLWLIVTP
jgi:hypothetical protein